MKKKYLLFLLLLIPFNVKAASMKVNCNKLNVEPSSTVTCTVSVFDSEVSGGEGSVSVTNGTIKSASKNSCGYGNVANDKFSCVDDVTSSSMVLATYTIEVGSEGTTTFKVSNANVVGLGYDTINVGSVSASITIKQPKQEVKEEVKQENKQEDKKPTVIATKPEEKKETQQEEKDEIEETLEEEQTEEVVLEEKHGLKSFTLFGMKYDITENSDHTYTIDVETNETNVDFKFETYSLSDAITISETNVKDGFNKLIVKCSYQDIEEEYIIYLYKKPLVEKENNFIKYALSFVCGFLLGIALSLVIKVIRKRKHNN